MGRQKEYYVFRRPNAMIDHRFTDDVALVKAVSKAQAIKLFSRYYADIQDDEVFKLLPRKYHSSQMIDYDIVHILTDY